MALLAFPEAGASQELAALREASLEAARDCARKQEPCWVRDTVVQALASLLAQHPASGLELQVCCMSCSAPLMT